jgi:branched-chain amino acid transport system substrate-binding protein
VSGEANVNGARMALADDRGRIGRLRIVLRPIDDASLHRLEWDPGVTSNDAHDAVIDPTTIGYIGDLSSGASAISIPILNRAGIAQISPTSTAVGLTSSGPGAEPGEPQKYYPTQVRTFARVAPSDEVQATVQVRLQQDFGCARTFVVEDGEVDGEDMATSFDLAARSAGLDVTATQEYDPKAISYSSLASSIASTGANCILVSANTDSNAVLVTEQLAAGVPGARIFATSGMAESTYADPTQGGIPLSLDSRVVITSPALGASAYPPAGREFLAAYAKRYGTPEPDAILGYEATSLMLSAIDEATDHGRHEADRAKVVKAIFATRDRPSAVGRYSIDQDGDTTSMVYGVWTIVGGRLHFWTVLRG